MAERVFNPFTGKLDIVGLKTENVTPSNGDIAQYNSTTGVWEFVAAGAAIDTLILEEVPSGAIDGVNRNFTLLNSVDAENLVVYLNGARLQKVTIVPPVALGLSNATPFGMAGQGKAFSGLTGRRDTFDHASGSSTFTLGEPPVATGDGDYIVVTYKKV